MYEERCIIGESDLITQRQHLDRYTYALGFVERKKVLDIACGTGYGTYMLSKKAEEVVGIDISNEAIQFANSNYGGDNIKYFVQDANDLSSLHEGTFDVVVSFETIEHLKDYDNFLAEIKRILHDDGMLIISTPNKIFASPRSKKPINPFHFREFELREFKNILLKYFSNVEVIGQDYIGITMKIRMFISKMIPKPIKNTYLAKTIKKKHKLRVISGIVDKKPKNCRYFIALCKK